MKAPMCTSTFVYSVYQYVYCHLVALTYDTLLPVFHTSHQSKLIMAT